MALEAIALSVVEFRAAKTHCVHTRKHCLQRMAAAVSVMCVRSSNLTLGSGYGLCRFLCSQTSSHSSVPFPFKHEKRG